MNLATCLVLGSGQRGCSLAALYGRRLPVAVQAHLGYTYTLLSRCYLHATEEAFESLVHREIDFRLRARDP